MTHSSRQHPARDSQRWAVGSASLAGLTADWWGAGLTADWWEVGLTAD